MYRNILRLISGKYYFYSISLCFCLFFIAILNGAGISIIAPLLEIDKSGVSSNFLIKIFHDIFQYCGIGLSIINILFLVLAIVVLGTIFTVVTVYLQNQIQLNHEIAQKGYLYNLLSNVHINTLYGLNFGNVIQVIQQETRMSAKLIEYFVRSISGVLNATIFLALVFIISIKMTVYVGVVIGIFFYFFKHIYSRSKILGRDIGKINDALQQNVNIMLYGYKTIKAYLTYNVLIQNQIDELKKYKSKNRELAIVEAVSGGIFEPLAIFVIISSYVFYQYTVAELFVFMAAVVKLYSSIKEVQNTYYKTSYHYASLERIEKLKKQFKSAQYNYVQKDGRPYSFEREINIKNVSFDYSNGISVLKDVLITIPKGSRVGLVGKSGMGKSTMVDLLMRFYFPQRGKLELDGVNFESIEYNGFISKIGYVPQEAFMINSSIKDNVVLYREISDDDVIQSLKLANAWEFIEPLSEGIYTRVGEHGTMISGGQKQRIALARAIAGHPDILILDEATSSLDNESERMVQQAIDNLARDITIIIIAHRLSTVRNVDNIYVFEDGRVAQEGSYSQLAQQDGIFKQLLDVSEEAKLS
ncbi:MAG: ABC transporter ATP-binding protein [Bacteroidetes bacterium]|nr:ABC transporter ATP-binding protein [Bacteroidota bacterium]